MSHRHRQVVNYESDSDSDQEEWSLLQLREIKEKLDQIELMMADQNQRRVNFVQSYDSVSSSEEDYQAPSFNSATSSPARTGIPVKLKTSSSTASGSRKSPSRTVTLEISSSSDSEDPEMLGEDSTWTSRYATGSSVSKEEKKTKALNTGILMSLQNNRNKVKRQRLLGDSDMPIPDIIDDPEDTFKLSPDLKVGDFLTGDYTREIELKNSFLRDISGLWKSKEMSDVTIECEDGSIQAHKLLLSARSDVFRAMFESGMTEASLNVVKIEDVKVQIMNILLQFMYTGRVGPLTVTQMTDIIVAADKYQMSKLKDSCFLELIRKINYRNIGEIVLLAHTHNCSKEVKALIQHRLIRDRPHLWSVPEFKEIAIANPLVLTTFLFEDF